MRKNIALLAFFVFTLNCYSQTNLVNNGSFESYSNCPTAFSQVDYATGWMKSYTGNINTGNWHTEYMNSCNSGNWVGVPLNGWGTQAAFEGNGYIAQAPSCPLAQANYRENVYTQLSSPLVIGTEYRISYRVSLGEECKYAGNHICAKFGTDTIFAIDNSAHCSSGLITDKVNWTLVTDTFTADSSYTYLCIGNFYTDANTLFNLIDASANNNNGVYYIDSVQVYDITGKIGIQESGSTGSLDISPNPAHDIISISGLTSEQKGNLEMYSIDGKLIASWNIEVISGNAINVALPADCPKGYYLIRFIGETTNRTEKLLIE